MISIITPNYNSEAYIKETAQSIISQSSSNWEWIIIDDGSSDKSPSYLKNLALKNDRIFFFKRYKKPKGPSTCRNIGIQKAKGEYIIFLDADDFLSPFCIEQRDCFINKNHDLDFAVFKMQWFNNLTKIKGEITNTYINTRDQSYLELFLLGTYPWQTPCPIWKKSTLQRLGGFNEQLLRNTDPDLHTRALLLPNVKFEVLPEVSPDCFYRFNPNNNTKFQLDVPNKIRGTLKYYISTHELIKLTNDYAKLKKKLRQGILCFLKKWVLSRTIDYRQELEDIRIWGRNSRVFSVRDSFLLSILIQLWNKPNSKLIKFCRIKGIINLFLR